MAAALRLITSSKLGRLLERERGGLGTLRIVVHVGRAASLMGGAMGAWLRIHCGGARPRCPPCRLSHRDQASPLAPRGQLDAKGYKREHRPANMENHSRNNDQAARDRTNTGTFPNVGEVTRGTGWMASLP